MSLTRANVESILIQRTGAFLTAAGLDGSTVSGANASLNDPIGFAIRAVGGTVASPVLVTDSDVATVGASSYDELFDRAELRTLQSALTNYTLVNTTAGPLKTEAGALALRMETRIEKLSADIDTQYDLIVVSAAPYAGGTSVLDKQTQEEDTDRVQPAFAKGLHTIPGTVDPWWGYP